MTGSLRNRVYWWCQLGGWTVYGVGNLLLGTLLFRGDVLAVARWTVSTVLVCLVGLLVTDRLRAIIRRRRWTDGRLFRTAVRVLAASFVGGAALHLGVTLVGMLLGLFPLALPPLRVLEYTFNLSATIFIWCCLYFGEHYFERLQLARTAALRATLAARESQLAMLRAQLEPHFLFNCLNSVRALISEDPSRAQVAVTHLADLLHYTLAADRRRTVSLEEEMQAVTDYLRLEAIRFEDRLRVDVKVDPETQAARIPPMLVQTLVENAIKHGVAQQPGGGTVEVSLHRVGGGLRLRVRNAGHLRGDDSPATGVGLVNARERLQLLYGPEARLELHQESEDEDSPGPAVVAEVWLPSLVPAEPAP